MLQNIHWRSVAVQSVSEPEISHGAVFILRADARVRVQQPLQICLEGRSKAKSVTNNLPILSVLAVAFYFSFSFRSSVINSFPVKNRSSQIEVRLLMFCILSCPENIPLLVMK